MLGKFFRAWRNREDGAAAIEFGLLAIPYILLSVAIIELSIMYAAASLLEGGTQSAARMIRTGQLQRVEGSSPEEAFRHKLCDHASVLLRCDGIAIDVRRMDSYSDFSSMQPRFDEDGNMVVEGFDPGESNSKILVRASYRYKMMTPLVGRLLAGPSNSRLFISTIVLQSEPYEFGGV